MIAVLESRMGWSTDEDRQALTNAFQTGGDEALYKYLGKQEEMGFVSLPRTMGYQVRYAYQSESEGKRVIAKTQPIKHKKWIEQNRGGRKMVETESFERNRNQRLGQAVALLLGEPNSYSANRISSGPTESEIQDDRPRSGYRCC